MLKRILWVSATLIFAYLASYSCGTSGAIAFYSPDTLEQASRFEVRCRVTGALLYRGPLRLHELDLVRFLVGKGYWKKSETDTPYWIPLFHWNHAWRDGESDFHRAFFWHKKYWMEWTNKNPDAAAQFWPKILDLLRNGKENEATELLQELRWEVIMKPPNNSGFSPANGCL